MNLDRLKQTLIRHEGLKLKPYKCTSGKITIGAGRNLSDNGISLTEAMILLDNDIEICEHEIIKLVPGFWNLDDIRQEVLINMLFNLGAPTLARFAKFLKAVNEKDFKLASKEMLHSVWAIQVGNRAIELSEMMRIGEIK